MKHIVFITVLALFVSVGVAHASSNDRPELNLYLSLQRSRTPSAVVCAGFYDWRSISKYRSHAGLHLGYDVAMPPGSPVVAGWTGQVTRITPWYGEQVGITILSPSGYEATYGHISPRCHVGDVLNAGDVVGVTLIDHVDIKMRGPDGAYFDPGHGTAFAAGGYALPHTRTRAEELQACAAACSSARQAEDALCAARDAAEKARSAYDDEMRAGQAARRDLPRLRKYLEEDLVARVVVEQAEARARRSSERLRAFENRWKTCQREAAACRLRVESLRLEETACRDRLRQMGVSEIELRRAVRGVAKAHEDPARVHPQRLAQAEAEVQRMVTLYDEGAASADEVERARENYRSALRTQE